MKKELYIKDLKYGTNIESAFIVSKLIKKTKKSRHDDSVDEEYCQVRLQDSSGLIDGIIWPEALKKMPDFKEEDCVTVKAYVSQFKGLPQLVISALDKVPDNEIDNTFFIRTVPSPEKEKMIIEIRKIVSSIKNSHLRQLLDSFFNDSRIFNAFTNSAAAVRYHHAYSGGLLEHSLTVAKNCDMIAGNYPELDRDLVVAGALLHDIGKIEEYKTGITIKITDEGGLIGHIAMGYGMVLDRINSIAGFDRTIAKNILHIIISHHGYKEFGSPRVPETPEAFVVYHTDHMDADIFHEKFEVSRYDDQLQENSNEESDISGMHVSKNKKSTAQRHEIVPRQEEFSGF
ncbi:MAG: 3'-5' exoribonuclease YhaM [Actinobacteria bacterium ADurb.Bin346]|nr:MAG: 3'-5' exoribonuclease YhaM [Actinobacteria bacterium ADurb.Bin346]